MQRIDVLIVGALIVAAAGSLIGVVTYEDDRLGEFTIDWTIETSTIEADVMPHTGGGAVESLLSIAEPNITSITFVVTITATPALVQPTDVLVEVVSPTNNTTSVEDTLPIGPGGAREVPVEVDLAPVPDATAITGPTLDAARNALNATLSSSLGIGGWTVRVTFAPSAPGPIGAQESHTVGVVANIDAYRGELVVVGPEVGR